VGGTVQVDLADSILVGFNNAFNTITFWVEYVAVEGKAMICGLVEGWNRRSKPESGYFFIRVVVLQNTSYTFNCVVILVLINITGVMQRIWLARLDVRQSKVNRN
jgi:hypothetical protein